LSCVILSRGILSGYLFKRLIKFADPPELYLDNFEGEVDCLSDEKNKSVSTVRCRSPSECEFMKHCFSNASLCNFNRQKQFFSEKNTRCWVEGRGKGFNCASVPYSHLNGIVQCSVNGLHRHWEFFVSLDFLRRKYSKRLFLVFFVFDNFFLNFRLQLGNRASKRTYSNGRSRRSLVHE